MLAPQGNFRKTECNALTLNDFGGFTLRSPLRLPLDTLGLGYIILKNRLSLGVGVRCPHLFTMLVARVLTMIFAYGFDSLHFVTNQKPRGDL